MLFGRRHRFIAMFFALCSFLFMQLAVASYACPGAASKVAEVAAMVEAGMPCAESMSSNRDKAQPNLCQAHCQAGHQTADKYELPSLPTAVAIGPMFTHDAPALVFSWLQLQAPHLMRRTAPPLAIRNCCFRI
ncbi:MAG: hypothetical protein IV091_03445 [Polaromonas sp.]|nr:hypothetical protein [Polaromonas sp.]